MRRNGEEILLGAAGVLGDTEGLRDGWAGDVRIENSRVVAAALHLGGEQARDEGLADAALAAHNADDLLDAGALVKRLAEGLRTALAAALAAG